MIKIVKDKVEKNVTKGAYENFYKPLGYTIVNDGNKELKKEVEIKEEVEIKKVDNKDNEDKGEKKSPKIEEFKKR
jgi:hypothetical protein